MKTRVLETANRNEVCEYLLQGDVVAFPTDTVFGVGILFDDGGAIAKMKQAKGRDERKPFPMMVSDLSQLKSVAYLDEKYERLCEAFMPGAFTVVLKKKDCVADEVTNGKDTIAIRIPDDDFVLSVIREVGKPLLVTSANRSGGANTTNETEVLAQLDGRIAAVVKGQTSTSTASTIVDLTGDSPVILRQGMITKEDIEQYL
ncbi:MAG: threonylcarbamoyl-AMP synthase [Erysipelotrichaceae bacterium]|nr:threonylcarbamoyl-AMP synthase [Erysipelotrichaceae bacterium]